MDSVEEVIFEQWLLELKENGFIDNYEYHSSTLELIPEIRYNNIKIYNSLNYTPDFIIQWNESAKGLFMLHQEEVVNTKFDNNQIMLSQFNNISYVDVKGLFAGKHNNSAITFPILRKVLYDKLGIYVNKVVPKTLFQKTFTPNSYLTTSMNKERKINWEVLSLKEYIINANTKRKLRNSK